MTLLPLWVKVFVEKHIPPWVWTSGGSRLERLLTLTLCWGSGNSWQIVAVDRSRFTAGWQFVQPMVKLHIAVLQREELRPSSRWRLHQPVTVREGKRCDVCNDAPSARPIAHLSFYFFVFLFYFSSTALSRHLTAQTVCCRFSAGSVLLPLPPLELLDDLVLYL